MKITISITEIYPAYLVEEEDSGAEHCLLNVSEEDAARFNRITQEFKAMQKELVNRVTLSALNSL